MCAKCGCGCKPGKPEKGCKCKCDMCMKARNGKTPAQSKGKK